MKLGNRKEETSFKMAVGMEPTFWSLTKIDLNPTGDDLITKLQITSL